MRFQNKQRRLYIVNVIVMKSRILILLFLCFEAGKVNGKRKQITKCGFKTKNESYTVG